MHVNTDVDTCLLTLHGDFSPKPRSVTEEEEADLYSSFVSKSASLGWPSTYSSSGSPTIWGMEDAYLVDKHVDRGLVAWVQVGLMDSYVGPSGSSGPLLPIALCADEAVGDFGDFELKGAHYLVPLSAVTSETVNVANLDTWLYPTPLGFESSLAVTVWADAKTPTIGMGHAENLLKSPPLSGVLREITVVDDASAGAIEPSSSCGDQLGFQPVIRATAVASRWGAKQGACIATAIAVALNQTEMNGSVCIHIETLPV